MGIFPHRVMTCSSRDRPASGNSASPCWLITEHVSADDTCIGSRSLSAYETFPSDFLQWRALEHPLDQYRKSHIGFVEILRRIDRLRTISEVIGMPRTYVTGKRLAILLHFGTCVPPRDRQTAAYILTMALLAERFRRRSLQHLTAYGTVPHRRFWLLLRSRKGVSPGSL